MLELLKCDPMSLSIVRDLIQTKHTLPLTKPQINESYRVCLKTGNCLEKTVTKGENIVNHRAICCTAMKLQPEKG